MGTFHCAVHMQASLSTHSTLRWRGQVFLQLSPSLASCSNTSQASADMFVLPLTTSLQQAFAPAHLQCQPHVQSSLFSSPSPPPQAQYPVCWLWINLPPTKPKQSHIPLSNHCLLRKWLCSSLWSKAPAKPFHGSDFFPSSCLLTAHLGILF